jgi:hypothetical protein
MKDKESSKSKNKQNWKELQKKEKSLKIMKDKKSNMKRKKQEF